MHGGPNYVADGRAANRFKSQPAGEAVAPIAADWWRLYRDPSSISSSRRHRLEPDAPTGVARVDAARALARVAAAFSIDHLHQSTFARLRTSGNRDSTVTGQRVQRVSTLATF